MVQQDQATQQIAAVIFNSPALDSLRHHQLRSLASRHGLKSTGKRDVLIHRLKALRQDNEPCPPDFDDESQAMSFSMIEAGEGEITVQLQRDTLLHDTVPRISTDEFGALQADAPTLVKSSSWKDKIAKVFGGGGSSSGISKSGSMDSISSHRSTSSVATVTASSSASSAATMSTSSTSRNGSDWQLDSSSKPPATLAHNIDVPPPTPAFKILEDSYYNASMTYGESSFVPRQSFEGDSVALSGVAVWPPVDPASAAIASTSQVPIQASEYAQYPSAPPTPARQKRRLDETDCTPERDGDLDDYFSTIRMLPRNPSPAKTPFAGACASGRKVKKLPARVLLLANSPVRFDRDPPPLPSLNGVLMQAMQKESEAKEKAKELLDRQLDRNAGVVSPLPTAELGDSSMEAAPAHQLSSTASERDALSSQPATETDSRPHETVSPPPMFVFGSPEQKPVTNGSFSSAANKVLEEMQRRMADRYPEGVKKDVVSFGKLDFGGRKMGEDGKEKRFDSKHEQEFAKMDSIAAHYAAKRGTAGFVPQKRTKVDALPSKPSSSSLADNLKSSGWTGTSSSSAPAPMRKTSSSSSLALLGQSRPAVLPRPAPAKSEAQKATDRKRVQSMQSASGGLSSLSKRIHKTAMGTSDDKISTEKALPMVPEKKDGSANSRGGLFKSTFNSLKSFASSTSLSSKLPSSSTTTQSLQQPASTTSLMPRSTTNASLCSDSTSSRPVVRSASINGFKRVPSVVNTLTSQRSTPSLSAKPGPTSSETVQATSTASRPSHTVDEIQTDSLSPLPQDRRYEALAALPSPPQTRLPSSTSKHGNLPASKLSQTPSKKRVSSISTSQRSGKAGELDARIASAKKIRARRDRQQSAGAKSDISTVAISEGVIGHGHSHRSVRNSSNNSSLAGISPAVSSLTRKNSSLAGRPAWR